MSNINLGVLLPGLLIEPKAYIDMLIDVYGAG